jgi:hypothetical protein
MLPELWMVVSLVVRVLEDLDINYYIGGSVASSRHGIPRLTRDVDFIADLPEEKVGSFVTALQEHFYVDDLAVRRAVRTQRSFNLIHFETTWKVDVFIQQKDQWANEKMQRREKKLLDEGADAPQVYLSSAEDIVLQKMRWFQKGGGLSDQQWNDLLNVLKVQTDRLDYVYLKHWAAELELDDLLAQALADAGIAV